MTPEEALKYLDQFDSEDPGTLAVVTLREELEKLRGIVAKLDKTADHVPVTRDLEFFCPEGHQIEEGMVDLWTGVFCCECLAEDMYDDGSTHRVPAYYPFEKCFSTREAAERAKNGGA